MPTAKVSIRLYRDLEGQRLNGHLKRTNKHKDFRYQVKMTRKDQLYASEEGEICDKAIEILPLDEINSIWLGHLDDDKDKQNRLLTLVTDIRRYFFFNNILGAANPETATRAWLSIALGVTCLFYDWARREEEIKKRWPSRFFLTEKSQNPEVRFESRIKNLTFLYTDKVDREPPDPGLTHYKTIKTSLASILRRRLKHDTITKAVCTLDKIVTRSLMFLKLYLIHTTEDPPIVDKDFMDTIFKTVCKQTTQVIPPSASNKTVRESLTVFYDEHFKSLLPHHDQDVSYTHLNTKHLTNHLKRI